MQWSQIKTLFILSFLILDIYLIIQFVEKQNQANVGIIEHEGSTIEQMLEDENIQIPKLPDVAANEPFITVSQKNFSEEELKMIQNLESQETAVVNNFVVSLLKQKIVIPEHATNEAIESIAKGFIAFPEEYILWDWNKDFNILILFQTKMGRPVYFNQNGVVLLFLNDDNEVVFYTQTILGDADAREDEKNLITPIRAIETLYQANELRPGDKVTKVDMGFHTRVPLANGVQVFVPAWKLTVNKNRNYFVNAIEGWNFSSNEINFLEESIKHDLERVQSMTDDEKLKRQVISLLNEKLDRINRGGKE